MRLLDEVYMDNPYYGVRKLVVIFVLKGYRVNIKRMRRLMKIQGWRTLYCTPHTTKIDPTKYKYPYLLKGYSYELSVSDLMNT
jgi:putative transposase